MHQADLAQIAQYPSHYKHSTLAESRGQYLDTLALSRANVLLYGNCVYMTSLYLLCQRFVAHVKSSMCHVQQTTPVLSPLPVFDPWTMLIDIVYS